jgi:hypothetical protein
MEDVISLTPKQLKGLVYHLNEELYRYSVHNDDSRRIVTERILNMCVNCYNSPNMVDSVEEQEKEQTELELAQHSPSPRGIHNLLKENEVTLIDGTKWSSKEYEKAFKDG